MKKNNKSKKINFWSLINHKTTKLELQVYIASLVFIALVFITAIFSVTYMKTRQSTYEIEADCNTGHIGLDFQSEYVNEEYISQYGELGLTDYYTTLLPKKLDIKDIDGLTCKIKIKGSAPTYAFINTILDRN